MLDDEKTGTAPHLAWLRLAAAELARSTIGETEGNAGLETEGVRTLA